MTNKILSAILAVLAITALFVFRANRSEPLPVDSYGTLSNPTRSVAIHPDSEEAKATQAAARGAWNQFETAFASRKTGDSFMVKIYGQGVSSRSEIWMDVLAIEGSILRVSDSETGEEQTIGLERVADWMFMSGGRMMGKHLDGVLNRPS